MVKPRVLKGYALEVQRRLPKACKDGHEYIWREVEPVIGTRSSNFGVCSRCKHLNGTNSYFVKHTKSWRLLDVVGGG